jgi:hypothetical protein
MSLYYVILNNNGMSDRNRTPSERTLWTFTEIKWFGFLSASVHGFSNN